MNDLTKEELEKILEGVTWWLDGDYALCSESLVNKIQSIIDNYCEHEFRYSNQAHFKCKNCGLREKN